MVNHEHYLVIGGAGFLGSYIVQALVARGEPHVTVYDVKVLSSKDEIAGVCYFVGDICDFDSLVEVLKVSGATTVFHTASPIHGLSDSVYQQVNVTGTETLLKACRESSLPSTVSKFIYTSSTGVIWSPKDFIGATEAETPTPIHGYDMYHHTKAVAEKMVLSADGKGFRTVALRPCGMVGPRDPQLFHRLATVLAEKQHKVQIGGNKNLIDYVYAGNVADAHLLAADRLPSPAEDDPGMHPIAGQAFFITNGEPIPQWDFNRLVWRGLKAPEADLDPKNVIKIPRWLAIGLAALSEAWCKLTGGTTEFNLFAVRFVTATQWYNIDKARTALGYEPKVSLKEAIQLTVEWWKERGSQERAEMLRSRNAKL